MDSKPLTQPLGALLRKSGYVGRLMTPQQLGTVVPVPIEVQKSAERRNKNNERGDTSAPKEAPMTMSAPQSFSHPTSTNGADKTPAPVAAPASAPAAQPATKAPETFGEFVSSLMHQRLEKNEPVCRVEIVHSMDAIETAKTVGIAAGVVVGVNLAAAGLSFGIRKLASYLF